MTDLSTQPHGARTPPRSLAEARRRGGRPTAALATPGLPRSLAPALLGAQDRGIPLLWPGVEMESP